MKIYYLKNNNKDVIKNADECARAIYGQAENDSKRSEI